MSVTVRTIRDTEFETFRATFCTAIGFEPHPEDAEALRAVLAPERVHAGFDGAAMVGTTGAFSLRVSVPGGELPMAGTTLVGVLPTHRRRGVLRNLMQAHFDDAVRRGDVLAGLWASEAAIYGHFGYGPAAVQHELELQAHRARLLEPATGSIRLAVMDSADGWAIPAALYDTVRAGVPGMLARDDTWWRWRRWYDPRHRRPGGAGRLQLAIHEDGGAPRGYLLYRRSSEWHAGYPDDRLIVVELVATTPAARHALWSYALSMDLVARVKAWNQPADEPLPWLLADPRSVHGTSRDSLWLRILDLPRALTGRRYASTGSLTMAVTDPQLPANHGSFRLDASPDGATVQPHAGPADLTLHIRDLAAVFLGGHRLHTLAAASRVHGSPATLARADALFASPAAPWCPEIF